MDVTDEMVAAFCEAEAMDPARTRDGLAAVLAIVERDYTVFAHCEEPHPTEPFAVCELARGHSGGHTATVERAVDW